MSKLEQQISLRGPVRQDKLLALSEKLKSSIDKEAVLFSEESDLELKAYFSANKESVPEKIAEAINFVQSLDSSNYPAHENAHIIDNLVSALRIIEEYGDFETHEKVEVALACMLHDVSRKFDDNNLGISQKNLTYFIPAMLGRKQVNKMTEPYPEVLQLRVLHDIYTGFVAKTGHKTADTVHQCDREQLNGGVVAPRFFSYDHGVHKKLLEVPSEEREGFKKSIPLFETAEDKYFFLNVEFFMRNIYAPTSPKGQAVLDKYQAETAAMLMLASHEDKENFEMYFAPELGLAEQPELGRFKKPLKPEVFSEAEKQTEDFLSRIDPTEFREGKEIESLLKLCEVENIALPGDFRETYQRLSEGLPARLKRNVWLMVQYATEKLKDKRQADLAFLESLEAGELEPIKQWAIKELKGRQDRYNKLIEQDHE